MTKFIAKLKDDSYINIEADEIVTTDDAVIAMNNNVVAYINMDFCLCAHLSDKDKNKEERK